MLERATIVLPQGQDLPSLVGVSPWIFAAAIGGAMIAFVYSSKDFRANFDYTLGGVVTGLVVVGGWYVSGVIGHVAEDPNTLQEAFVATNTGRMESFSRLADGIHARVPDAVDRQVEDRHLRHRLGARGNRGLGGLRARDADVPREGFRDAEDTANHVVGGILMGFGGITALGCTIGQAISGFDARARLDPDFHRDRRGLRGDDEVPVLASQPKLDQKTKTLSAHADHSESWSIVPRAASSTSSSSWMPRASMHVPQRSPRRCGA